MIQRLYSSKRSSKPEEERNEEYLQSHRDSARHVHATVRLRQALKPGVDEAKTKSVNDLQTALGLPSVSLQDASEGLHLLRGMGAAQDAQKAYLEAARQRWPEATLFQEA